jgi:hypothetical protein
MNTKKPVINIFAGGAKEEAIKEVLAGIEEEGALYEVFYKEEMEAEKLSYEAAEESLLETGIGINKQSACINISKLPLNAPLLKVSTLDRPRLRLLGSNAARFVKGIPFKFINE